VMPKLRKHYRGCYRFDLNDFAFGQVIKQENGEWAAEIRQCVTGSLIRDYWLWNTRKDAVEEILSINPVDYLDHSIGR